jgi:hypothetical protein
VRDLAGDQVGLVERRAGDEEVGVGDAGVAQHRGLQAVAHHAAQVEPVLQRGQPRGVGVDHGDVVALGDEALGDALADAAGAEDDDVHGVQPPGRPLKRGLFR